RVAFEEGEIRTVAADGQLDGQRAVPRQCGQRLANQRRLPVAARRDQEHLLAVAEVGDQAVELGLAVDEGVTGSDFAVDEGVGHGRASCRSTASLCRST